jgi:hypothetical protein
MIEPSSPLGQFFGSFFHPDWHLDDDSSEMVVDRFVRSNHPQQVLLVCQQLDDLMRQFDALSDPDLEREMLVVGAYYRSKAEKRPVREWLRVVSSRLRGAATHSA